MRQGHQKKSGRVQNLLIKDEEHSQNLFLKNLVEVDHRLLRMWSFNGYPAQVRGTGILLFPFLIFSYVVVQKEYILFLRFQNHPT